MRPSSAICVLLGIFVLFIQIQGISLSKSIHNTLKRRLNTDKTVFSAKMWPSRVKNKDGSRNEMVCDTSISTHTPTHTPSLIPSLLFINTLMFLFYASLGSVMPYLPIYYRQLGLNGMGIDMSMDMGVDMGMGMGMVRKFLLFEPYIHMQTHSLDYWEQSHLQ